MTDDNAAPIPSDDTPLPTTSDDSPELIEQPDVVVVEPWVVTPGQRPVGDVRPGERTRVNLARERRVIE